MRPHHFTCPTPSRACRRAQPAPRIGIESIEPALVDIGLHSCAVSPGTTVIDPSSNTSVGAKPGTKSWSVRRGLPPRNASQSRSCRSWNRITSYSAPVRTSSGDSYSCAPLRSPSSCRRSRTRRHAGHPPTRRRRFEAPAAGKRLADHRPRSRSRASVSRCAQGRLARGDVHPLAALTGVARAWEPQLPQCCVDAHGTWTSCVDQAPCGVLEKTSGSQSAPPFEHNSIGAEREDRSRAIALMFSRRRDRSRREFRLPCSSRELQQQRQPRSPATSA